MRMMPSSYEASQDVSSNRTASTTMYNNTHSLDSSSAFGYSFPASSSAEPFALQPIYFSSTNAANTKPRDPEVHWRWSSFKNAARNDGLELSHWNLTRVSDASSPCSAPSPFAVLNTHAEVVQYTQEEWDQYIHPFLQNEPYPWSKLETDYLFDLCRQWDLRFPLIEDRWEPPIPNAPPRDMEDLKSQYLRVTHAVLHARHPLPAPPHRRVLSALLQFDPAAERERKRQLQVLWQRPAWEVREEEELWELWTRFERAHACRTKDRQEVLARFYRGLDPHIWAAQSSHRCKLREHQWMQPAPAATQPPQPLPPPTLPAGVVLSSEKKTPGVFLRSAKAAALKPALQNKLNSMLQELQISRPKMFTHDVFHRYEELRKSILTLVDAKKSLEKLEAELKHVAGRQGGASASGVERKGGDLKKRK